MKLLRRTRTAQTKACAITAFACAASLSFATTRDARADESPTTQQAPLIPPPQPTQPTQPTQIAQGEDEGLSDAVLDARGSVKRATQSLEEGVFTLANERAHEAIRRARIAYDLKSYVDALMVLQEARARARHVTFVPPSDVDDVEVRFDGMFVKTEDLTRRYMVNAGDHEVEARGTRVGVKVEYKETLHLDLREFRRVRLPMTVAPPRPPPIGCIPIECFGAKNQEALATCVKTGIAPK